MITVTLLAACVPNASSSTSVGPRQATNEIKLKLDPSFGQSGRKTFENFGNSQRLHRLVYVIAILGVTHYWWLVKKDITQPLIYALILAALLAFRLLLKVNFAGLGGLRKPSLEK